MNITKRPFGTLADGRAVTCWCMDNGVVQAEVLDYGVTIRSLVVDGVDVVLGYDTIEEYVANDGYLGATIGRVGNRIAGSCFELNGKNYHLYANDGKNHLHGGKEGFDAKIWNVEETENGIVCSYLSVDGEENYPGNLQVKVTVTLEGKAIQLKYWATTDADTILNLTNHTYFNLDGKGDILSHTIRLGADRYCAGDEGCLPTGELAPVQGTAMDFLTPHMIGERIDADEDCVKLSGGYDSNFIISSSPAAVVKGAQSGITMTVTTTEPGVQFYSGNFMKFRKGKNGAIYHRRYGFCLETQHFPDSIHHPEWPTCILKAGETYESTTKYAF
ncbi:MAG: galactose mutarotase [Oscillospiraceae bacterium]|nr:galactose mutarotase [Oscillospiraceae bacterium]